MKRIIIFIVLVFSVQWGSKAQEFESLLLAADDASLLTQRYLNPAAKGLMFSMNDGWATTARIHEKFGFDITIGINASFVPNADKTFAFMTSEYDYISLPNGETELNTVMGQNNEGTKVDISISNEDGTYRANGFTMPRGITKDLPINAVPAPMVQVGFGLPFKTDIKVRFVPSLNYDDDLKASLTGFGLQHDLTQYFGVVQKLPLSVSILGAFTTMNVAYGINNKNAIDHVTVNNGEAEFKLNTWTIQALASLDFRWVTFYGGVGYNSGKTTMKMKGDYILTYDIEDSNGTYLGTATESVSNPINLGFNADGMRANLGARLNLGIFKLFADYTLQEYNTATLGIALSVR